MDPAGGERNYLDVSRGLFLVRYDTAEDAANPPRVALSPEGWDPSELQFVLPPDAEQPVLWSPGGSLILRALRAGRIMVTVISSLPQGSTVAGVQLVPLTDDPLDLGLARPIDLSKIKVLGHLSGIGDVRVACNEWLGGPASPSRIEGIALEMADLPETLRFRYSVRIGGSRPVTGEMFDAGAFAGTRGRALPLVGATFEISGRGAARYVVVAEALFLGSPVMRVSGQRVVVAGPTGREPLVGLRLSVNDTRRSTVHGSEPAGGTRTAVAEEDVSHLQAPAAPSPGSKSSLRVFRSNPSQGQQDDQAKPEMAEAPPATRAKVKVLRREDLKDRLNNVKE